MLVSTHSAVSKIPVLTHTNLTPNHTSNSLRTRHIIKHHTRNPHFLHEVSIRQQTTSPSPPEGIHLRKFRRKKSTPTPLAPGGVNIERDCTSHSTYRFLNTQIGQETNVLEAIKLDIPKVDISIFGTRHINFIFSINTNSFVSVIENHT